MLNLLNDRWIPARRASGEFETIAPWQLTEGLDADPVVSLDAPRLDFNASLLQFLIGLLQTLSPPEDEDAWDDWRDSPPNPEQLKEHWSPFASYFKLAGESARFMQDFELREGEPKPISALLIDAPGAKSERDNTDHFVKRGCVTGLSPACAAMALLTLQTNAPAGGQGNRTSLRGGGPLTTLVMPMRTNGRALSLWELLWWNVLPKPTFLLDWDGPDTPEAMFPWAGPIRTSDPKSGYVYAPVNTHPAHVYWATPRRVRLDFDQTGSGVCSLSGEQSESLVCRYITKNYGANYVGWRHPLSPYYYDKDRQLLPVHAQPGGMTYRHWLGLVANQQDGGKEAARVVREFGNRASYTNDEARLWAFGYDMDNMKPRCWYESNMPLPAIPEGVALEYFISLSKRLIAAAELCAGYLRTAIRQAWFGPADKVDTAKLAYLDSVFWQDTEATFYDLMQKTAGFVKSGEVGSEERVQLCSTWYRTLRHQAIGQFDYHAYSGAWEYENAERIALARNELEKKINGKKLRTEALDLPAKSRAEPEMETEAMS